MINKLLGIILWLGVNIPFTRYFSDSTPLKTPSRHSACPIFVYLSRFIPLSKCFHSGVSWHNLLRLSVLQRYLESSLSSPYVLHCIPSCQIWNCPSAPYWEFRLTLLKDSIMIRYSDMIFLISTIYLLSDYCLSL